MDKVEAEARSLLTSTALTVVQLCLSMKMLTGQSRHRIVHDNVNKLNKNQIKMHVVSVNKKVLLIETNACISREVNKHF